MYTFKIIMRNTLKTKCFTGNCGICVRGSGFLKHTKTY